MKKILGVALALITGLSLAACNKPAAPTKENQTDKANAATTLAESENGAASEEGAESESAEETADGEAQEADKKAPTPDEDDAAGFTEVPIGEVDLFPLHVAGVYLQPVDMEPAGNSLPKKDSDMHLEADISALANNELGFEEGVFVPYLQVKAFIQKKGSDKVEEVAFMPMNAGDGPHYGANVKMPEGLGKYIVRFEISAPGNEYLLHVDKETGIKGRFWTEPLVAEWEFDWTGPKW